MLTLEGRGRAEPAAVKRPPITFALARPRMVTSLSVDCQQDLLTSIRDQPPERVTVGLVLAPPNCSSPAYSRPGPHDDP